MDREVSGRIRSGQDDQEPGADDLKCSFCGKGHAEVAKLFANPSGSGVRVYICNECIEVCHFILEEDPENPLPRHPISPRK
jgi:hypothetical protein